jgi:hypothetical protein
MSSYFDEASLVMIPSGYKDQKVYSVKPLDGSGDLTFSRASSATRVASNGLIEKVRTNLALQSNTFNTTWTLDDATLTSGQSGYDGTNNAWRLAKTAAGGRVQQTLSLSSNSHTFSVYVKAGTKNWVFLRADGTSNRTSYFDLQNGVVGTASGCTPSIVSAGNGWYRCSISYVDTTTSARIWVADADGDISGTSGNILIQAAQVETGDIATDYIATTSAAVSVGPVSGLPRLDYLNSTCPRLLLEPQRTNLITYSEQLNTGTGGTSSVTANSVVSPDGYTNADTIGSGYLSKSVSATAGTYTMSVFIKYQSSNAVLLYIYDGAYYQGSFNPSTGVATSSTGSPTVSMVSYGNGWWRCFVTATTANNISEIGFGSGNVYAYGLSLEAGAYATSYIPTLGTSVTRVADAALTASIPSVIGQTEGTLYAEMTRESLAESFFMILSNVAGTTALAYYDSIYIFQLPNANFVSDCFINNVAQYNFSYPSGLSVGTHKIALAYKQNDFALYIDGVQIATDTSGNLPTMNYFTVGGGADVTGHKNLISQTILFPTRLSNSDLAALTA